MPPRFSLSIHVLGGGILGHSGDAVIHPVQHEDVALRAPPTHLGTPLRAAGHGVKFIGC